MDPTHSELDRMAARLRESGRYRVLDRLEPRAAWEECPDPLRRTALVVDVETTGLDPARDLIIQLAALPFTYCARSGQVLAAEPAVVFYEDPGTPLAPEVTRLTGITDDEVRGRRIDEAAVAALAAAAGLVIAHNAAFDRKFVERRLPALARKPWACSFSEVPWGEEGLGSGSLELLLYRHCARFTDAHRADADCLATLEVLATPLPSGRRPLALLLESARRPTVRLWATNAPIEVKDALKERRYRWKERSAGVRAWCRDLAPEAEPSECEWLAAHVYGGRRGGWEREEFGAERRYALGF